MKINLLFESDYKKGFSHLLLAIINFYSAYKKDD